MALKEAIGKAEDAQREYNVRSNEFRAQLGDQAKLLMPRAESEAMHLATRDARDRMVEEWRLAMENHKREAVLEHTALRTEIQGLRETRSHTTGRAEESRWLLSVVLTIAGLMLGVLGTLFVHISK